MADKCSGDPRLAALYDPLDPDRSDLDAYVRMAEEFGAKRVLDIGCGTGVFALLLADRGISVVGIDPDRASLDVARAKPGSARVRWICGDATTLSEGTALSDVTAPGDVTAFPAPQVDLVTMTANVAQEIADPSLWRQTLRGAYEALRPGGRLVFETRDPARRAWEEWHREGSYRVAQVPGVGIVQSWVQLIEVNLPLVTFRGTCVFAADGQVLTADSTLRFRERQEVERDLVAHGFAVEDVRDAPDRPGRELVFVALRP
ncbi:class I SAM-dependent methyltransferase [Streptomyces sp. NPDC047049]|uniref:class I SAM-dependent methyltransferase n=1 Tax=Streptomyces sp. NPDC047049 TaxID=3156688 RepID=UPI0034039F56